MHYTFGETVRKVRPTVAQIATLPNTKQYNSSGVLQASYASGGPVPILDTTASIVYTRKSKRFSKRSNLCIHSQWERKQLLQGSLPAIYATILDPPHAGWYWDIYWDYATAYQAHVAAVDTASLQFPSRGIGKLQAGWLDYAATGFQACQPDLTTTSVPNFLIDAEQLSGLVSDVRLVKDFGRLVLNPSVSESSSKSMRQLIRQLRGAQKGNLSFAAELGMTTRDLAKFVAGKRLSYKFGWTPTIGDLAAIFNSVLGTQAKLKAFKQSVGKELSFTKTLESVDSAKSGTFNLNNDVHYKVEWRGYLTGKVQYHAKYIPRPIVAVSEIDENIRGLMDTLGVELDPRIAWDAIPFSFVLDWFLGVGDWLHQFRVDALQLPIDLIDSAVSYKEDYIVGSAVTVNPNGYPTDVTSTTKPPGYYERTRLFHRMPVDPSMTLLKNLKWKNPTGSQWTNFVSLATVLGL
jgi:hypothetical protein